MIPVDYNAVGSIVDKVGDAVGDFSYITLHTQTRQIIKHTFSFKIGWSFDPVHYYSIQET